MRALLGVMFLCAAGCAPVLHTEMLSEAISSFSSKVPSGTKVWVTNTADSACNNGCASCAGKEKAGGLGGLFGGGSVKSAEGPYDRLAFEVFSNYLTQKKKARVIESHRHNYATELNPETHRKIEYVGEGGKAIGSSCEDLCLLDEAKKRKAEKVLVYDILQMSSDQMLIHFRLSQVASGMVEASQTIKVDGLRAHDESFGPAKAGAAGRAED